MFLVVSFYSFCLSISFPLSEWLPLLGSLSFSPNHSILVTKLKKLFFLISVLSLWGYADLCLTIFDFEKVDSKMAARSNFKILENLKGQITDHRNLALTKRSVLNCTMVVWQKYLLANNNHEFWDTNFELFTGIN